MDDTFKAEIELFPTPEGGLREPMPLNTTSLLLVFESLDDDSPGKVQIGGHIAAADRSALAAGDRVQVAVDFWADIGAIYATPGVQFKLWYAGRIVGVGMFMPQANDGGP